MPMFPIGDKVTVTAADHPHAGLTGRVRAYTDLAKADIIHVIDLGDWGKKGWEPKPLFVPDNRANPPEFGPGGPTGRKIHGEGPFPDMQVDWIEVPGSCLS